MDVDKVIDDVFAEFGILTACVDITETNAALHRAGVPMYKIAVLEAQLRHPAFGGTVVLRVGNMDNYFTLHDNGHGEHYNVLCVPDSIDVEL